jgi:hypothetical protein
MKKMMQSALLACTLLLPCVCAAQEKSGSTLSGPSLGLMFDSSAAAIRPILGIPGAARLGNSLDAGFPLGKVAVAPGGDFALAVSKDDFHLAVIRSSGTVVQSLAPAMGEAPDLISFSPRGRSAVLYYAASGRLLVLSGLRNQTAQSVKTDISSLPAAPSVVAVSENGATLLLAVPEGETASALYSMSITRSASTKGLSSQALEEDSADGTQSGYGVAQRVGTFQSISALRFVGAGADALVADKVANAAYVLQDASGAAHVTALGSAQDGLSQPVAIEALDARRVLVANAGAGKLTLLYRDGGAAESIACGCSPVVLQQLAGNLVYRLTEPSQEPIWVLDAGGAEARVLAVPPDRSQNVAASAEGAQR